MIISDAINVVKLTKIGGLVTFYGGYKQVSGQATNDTKQQKFKE